MNNLIAIEVHELSQVYKISQPHPRVSKGNCKPTSLKQSLNVSTFSIEQLGLVIDSVEMEDQWIIRVCVNLPIEIKEGTKIKLV